MGDRCYLELTLRRSDLARFAPHIDAAPEEKWWDRLDEDEANPELVTASVYEANYSWYDERMNAAKADIPFYGYHAEGGEYGSYAFASWAGKLQEAPLSHEGDLILAVDENLKAISSTARRQLRQYVTALRRIKSDFATAKPVGSLEKAA
jgi:hypothetical protein